MRRQTLSVLGYPSTIWFLFFLLAPLALVLVLSFLSRGQYGGVEWIFTTKNFARVFEPVYFGIFLKSVKLSAITATICFVLAYPMAWAMAASSQRTRFLFVGALSVPFLMNLIIRVYAVKLFTGMDGPLQTFLTFTGIVFDPFAMSQNIWLVIYGMVAAYLPFMVFPIYSSLDKLDFSLVEAAQDLGAGPIKILFSILIPATKKAGIAGFTLVFIPCLGEFVIPDLLGGAKTMLVGNLITEQFLKARDWPFGAALSMVLIGILFLIPLITKKVIRE